MAALNPKIRHTAIDGALFQDEVERRKVMAVPAVFLNGEPFGQGRMDLAQIVAKLDTGRSEEHTSELQSLMRISYAVFCLKKKRRQNQLSTHIQTIHCRERFTHQLTLYT